jgi:radical SAM protein with 4Fe4S-binding SPASM domain
MNNSSLSPTKMPTHMDVELSNKCNLRCRFCHLTYFEPEKNKQFSLSEFKTKIGPIIPHLNSITLFNKFEALTCRDFIPIFDYLSEFNVETYFSTNGLLLNKDVLDSIVGRLTYLTVSVSGFTQETYEKNMCSDGYYKLKEKLTELNSLKKLRKTRYPILRISTVAMLDNLNELEMAIDFTKEFDAEEGLQLTSFKSFTTKLNPLMPMNDIDCYTKKTEEAIRYADQKNVKLVLQSGALEDNQQQTERLGHRDCDLPWHRLSVQPNGDVYPCPMAYDAIDNIRDTSIEEIWNGSKLATFRAGVNDLENMNLDCTNCTHCRHRSLRKPEANDFSEANIYPTGLRRKNKVL